MAHMSKADLGVMAATMTVEEAAEALGISRGLAYRAARDGEIPAIRIGRRFVVPREALDRLLASGRRPEGRRP